MLTTSPSGGSWAGSASDTSGSNWGARRRFLSGWEVRDAGPSCSDRDRWPSPFATAFEALGSPHHGRAAAWHGHLLEGPVAVEPVPLVGRAEETDRPRWPKPPASPDPYTYVRTLQGWLYLAVVLDACSRRVVGWALDDQQRSELACAALRMALLARRPAAGLIHHSDRGSVYVGAAYRQLLEHHGARHSVGHPGTAWDNAVAESFFATLKLELVYRAVWPTRQAARTAIFAYIEGWYNRARLHSTLGYRSPLECELALRSSITSTPA